MKSVEGNMLFIITRNNSVLGSCGLNTIILRVYLSLRDYYTHVILITVKPTHVHTITSVEQSHLLKGYLLVWQWKISPKLNLFRRSLSQKCPLDTGLTLQSAAEGNQSTCTTQLIKKYFSSHEIKLMIS